MKNLDKKHFLILGIWLLINLLQSILTGLHSDESYYWMFSQNLDWGFFDHPPMAALFIYLGNALLPGEIGVRLFIVLLSTTTLALILNELNEKKDIWFLTIFVFSFPLIHTHIAGFLAIPDVPLLFFTMLFLVFYKRFLEKPNWGIAILLGIIIPAMIYSKYHAFIIIGFTVLSNFKLFKSKYFYGIIVLSAALLLPHILWQIDNEFPTFKYHLVERAKPFQFKYVLPYVFGVLAMAGPLTGVLVFWKLRKVKIKSPFQRALLFNVLGFIILFFVMSFKNRIEAHWVAAIIPMLMFLTYPLIRDDNKIRKWFKWLATPIIILLLFFRIYLALDIIPNIGLLKMTFYNREANAKEIKELASGKKVGFFNNYAAISNYIFYTGDSAVLLSTPDYRFSQYDLWSDEKYAEGEPLFAIQSKHLNPPNLTKMVTGEMKGYVIIEKFQSLIGLQIQWDKTVQTENEFEFHFTLTNTNTYPIFTEHISEPSLAIMQNKAELVSTPLTTSSENIKIVPGGKTSIQISIPKNQISENSPVIFYTRSKENVRGEMGSILFEDVLK
ncbi:MAG: hypothetical protein GQ525_04685 [Draconibacterium sp.]|nr:hypothetical protein [Draconibacterium sp.]